MRKKRRQFGNVGRLNGKSLQAQTRIGIKKKEKRTKRGGFELVSKTLQH